MAKELHVGSKTMNRVQNAPFEECKVPDIVPKPGSGDKPPGNLLPDMLRDDGIGHTIPISFLD